MSPAEVEDWLERGRALGCAEALFCLGDKPESAFSGYRRLLEGWGHRSTVDYLYACGLAALRLGLLPHTNAGILSRTELERLKEINVSLGLMLENISDRLCAPGMPHHRAPDKRPARRLAMLEDAGRLRIPFTTGILVGIGEPRIERIQSLLAIRALHRRYGHVQEVIVQNFRAHPGTPMADAVEPGFPELAESIALARLILDDDVSVQAPPNLSPLGAASLLAAGLNDFGGISPLTPDYINPGHPWPHLEALASGCDRAGFELRPRLAIYDRYLDRPGFLDPALTPHTTAAQRRLSAFPIVRDAGLRSASSSGTTAAISTTLS